MTRGGDHIHCGDDDDATQGERGGSGITADHRDQCLDRLERWIREYRASLTTQVEGYMGNHQISEAEDTVQRAFVTVLGLLLDRRGPDSPEHDRAWLGRVTKNQYRNDCRKREVRERVTPPIDPAGATLAAAAASDESLERRLDEIDSAVAFGRAFRNAKLSEDDRILLNLLFGQGLTVKEAAARMGIGHGVARKRKSRLLLRLRDQL
jgi:RNA polymerase sigma factor (sigma-70 family)